MAADWKKVLEMLNVPFREKKNGDIYMLCPLHVEKTGSMRLHKTKGFRCYGCGESGTFEEFVVRTLGGGGEKLLSESQLRRKTDEILSVQRLEQSTPEQKVMPFVKIANRDQLFFPFLRGASEQS